MTLAATPLHPLFAAAVAGADLRRPVDDAVLATVRALMARYAVCAFPHAEPLTNEEQIAFSLRLGAIGKLSAPPGTKLRIPHREIIDQSNLDDAGEIYADDDRRLAYKRANRLWHTDMSFQRVRATYSLLSAHTCPPAGGDTEFADMRAAYDALPAATRTRLAGLVAVHDYYHSRVEGGGPEPTREERALRPPARHPLVHVHAGSGRRVLYLASHASAIEGMPLDEGRALLAELTAHATRPEFVYVHRWHVGDLVIWDNLATMHRATPFDDRTQRRDVRRTTILEAV